MFRAHVLIVRRAKLYYTVSGIITPVGDRTVQGTATYRRGDTRDCVIQFCPPDDEHMCSKHVEAWNKLVIKFIASSWLILRNKKSLVFYQVPQCLWNPYRTVPEFRLIMMWRSCSNDNGVHQSTCRKIKAVLAEHTVTETDVKSHKVIAVLGLAAWKWVMVGNEDRWTPRMNTC